MLRKESEQQPTLSHLERSNLPATETDRFSVIVEAGITEGLSDFPETTMNLSESGLNATLPSITPLLPTASSLYRFQPRNRAPSSSLMDHGWNATPDPQESEMSIRASGIEAPVPTPAYWRTPDTRSRAPSSLVASRSRRIVPLNSPISFGSAIYGGFSTSYNSPYAGDLSTKTPNTPDISAINSSGLNLSPADNSDSGQVSGPSRVNSGMSNAKAPAAKVIAEPEVKKGMNTRNIVNQHVVSEVSLPALDARLESEQHRDHEGVIPTGKSTELWAEHLQRNLTTEDLQTLNGKLESHIRQVSQEEHIQPRTLAGRGRTHHHTQDQSWQSHHLQGVQESTYWISIENDKRQAATMTSKQGSDSRSLDKGVDGRSSTIGGLDKDVVASWLEQSVASLVSSDGSMTIPVEMVSGTILPPYEEVGGQIEEVKRESRGGQEELVADMHSEAVDSSAAMDDTDNDQGIYLPPSGVNSLTARNLQRLECLNNRQGGCKAPSSILTQPTKSEAEGSAT